MRLARALALVLLCTRSASAEPAPRAHARDVDAARSHFQRGVALYRSGAYDAAFAEFSRAYDAAPNYRVLYNLAQIQAQRHDYVEALALFERYLAKAVDQLPPARVEEVRAEMAELAQRITRLRVDTNVDGARLYVGDLPAIELPREEPLLLNAGIHRLRLEKAGYVSVSRTVTLVGGEEVSIGLELDAELDMDDVPPPPAPAPPTALPPAPPDRSALWASLVASGALTGATLTFGVLTQSANAQLDERLARRPPSRASVEASRERVRTFALLTDVFGLAAVGAAGLSTYLWLSESTEPEPSDAGLSAYLGPRSAGVSWTRAF